MKSKFIRTAIIGLSLLGMVTNVAANLITADSVSSLNQTHNNAYALIENAINTSYVAPNPASGGGGTSTYHGGPHNTWTFDFDSAYTLDTAYIWDYYGHSPTDWLLTFFGSTNGVGPALFSHNFSMPNAAPATHDSDLYTINFASVADVRSVTLQNVNTSVRGGVGLAEVHFGGTAVPEPSTLAILGLGLLGLASRRFKKQA